MVAFVLARLATIGPITADALPEMEAFAEATAFSVTVFRTARLDWSVDTRLVRLLMAVLAAAVTLAFVWPANRFSTLLSEVSALLMLVMPCVRAALVAGATFAMMLLNEPIAEFSTLLALFRAALTVALTAAIPAAVYGTAAFAASAPLTCAAADSCSGMLAVVYSTLAASPRKVAIELIPFGPSAPSRVVAVPGLAVALLIAWIAVARSALSVLVRLPSAAATVELPNTDEAALTAELTAVATLFSALTTIWPLAAVGAPDSPEPMVFRLVVTPPSRLFSVFVIVDSVLVSSVPAAVPMLVTAVFSAFSVEETTLFTRFSIGRFVLIVPLPATPMLPMLRLPLRVPEVPEINEVASSWSSLAALATSPWFRMAAQLSTRCTVAKLSRLIIATTSFDWILTSFIRASLSATV
uniref:Uncharacterized protein n=1 Tax=Anopheles merus TaxID=30066 RepID=A0A182V2T2_ANOME